MTENFNKFYSGLTNDTYSIIDIDIDGLTPYLLMSEDKYVKSYSPVYLISEYRDNKIIHNEGVFKHPGEFYICLFKNKEQEVFKLRVVYKVKQYEEVKMFISGLKKLKK